MERNYALDYVKFFAILAVVVIHVPPIGGELGSVLKNISRFAVPFFFAASGYLFTLKSLTSNPNNHFKRTILKLTKIYFCWYLIYFIYDLIIKIISYYFNDVSITYLFQESISNLTFLDFFYYGNGTSGYQLWFLPALFWSMLFLFISLKLKKIEMLFVVSLILNLIGLFGQSYSRIFTLNIETRDPVFFGLFYTVLGGIIAIYKRKTTTSKQANLYFLLFLLCLILQIFERYILSLSNPKIDEANYFISTIFLTLFLMLFLINKPHIGRKSVLKVIGSNSLGVYVIHVLVIRFTMTLMTFFNLDKLMKLNCSGLVYLSMVFISSYVLYNLICYIKRNVFTKIREDKTLKQKLHI